MSEEQELTLLREQIDQYDYKIHDLVNERAKLALQVANVKVKYQGKNVNFSRPEREKSMLEKIKQYNSGPLDTNAIAHIFQTIIKECLHLQIKAHEQD